MVVYGLWGVFVLIPKLLPAEQWFASTFSFIPWIGGGTVTGPNYFIAGLILAIMILPIVSAISREVIATVPSEHKEAALALGATRWEMIRMAVLPYARPGIAGGAMLGLGRALGETIAIAKSAPQQCRVLINIGRAGVVPEGDTMDINRADVSAAREAAWQNGELLWHLRAVPPLSSQFMSTLDGLATVVGKALLIPAP